MKIVYGGVAFCIVGSSSLIGNFNLHQYALRSKCKSEMYVTNVGNL